MFDVIGEDAELLVLSKPAGLVCHPTKTDAYSSLIGRVRLYLGPDAHPQLVNRLDRETSGLVVVAKTAEAARQLRRIWEDRRVEKEYLACVEREPEPPTGRLEHRLAWDKRRNVVRALKADSPSGKQAILEYRPAGRSDRYFFVEVRLITGRHHQIRAQLAAIGCPIRGDLKYGARRSAPSGLIMLHARALVLEQPRTRERIEVSAPFPAEEPLWAVWAGGAAQEGGESPSA